MNQTYKRSFEVIENPMLVHGKELDSGPILSIRHWNLVCFVIHR